MNNRERMKVYVLFAQGAGRRFFATEPIPFMDRTARMLLSLIDRQPSEARAKALCDKVEQGFIHHGSQPMTNNGWEALREIRKTLGIEGKE